MTYELFLGDYTYSSWSLRAWLLFDRFGIPARQTMIWFGQDVSVADQLATLAPPARTVPTLRTPDGAVIGDSLAIAEELASRHPHAGLWPSDPRARAIARSLTSEMHSGFTALRQHCPMNLRVAYSGYAAPAEVLADARRVDRIWADALDGFGGPWLCGTYSIADAFFAPVAARLAGYDLPMSDTAKAYVAAHLSDPAFRRWRAMALVRGDVLSWYLRDDPTVPWPGPEVRAAQPVNAGPATNDRCPYSGEPVTDFLECDGRIWGFCNPFCRDKTAADPDAWPAFAGMVAAARPPGPPPVNLS